MIIIDSKLEYENHRTIFRSLSLDDSYQAFIFTPSLSLSFLFSNLIRALERIQDAYQTRLDVVLDKSRELSAEAGEADLRRLKRQFSSLKNTFLHYVVKDEFIAALADGMPNGTEDIQLSRFDEEAQSNIEKLRELKEKNAATQDEIASLISEVNDTVATMRETSRSAMLDMEKLEMEIAAAEEAESALPPLESEDGPNEEECARGLAAEESEARVLESKLASRLRRIAEIEASLPAEREAAEFAKGEKEDLQQQLAALEGAADKAAGARFSGTAAWAEEASTLLESVGGIKIRSWEKDILEIETKVSYPIAAVRGGHLGVCHTSTYHLALRLESSTGRVLSTILSPSDVEIQDIVESASLSSEENSSKEDAVSGIVRKIRSRLAGKLHRIALIQEASRQYPGSVGDRSDASVTTTLALSNGRSATVQAVMDRSWPQQDDEVRIASVQMNTHDRSEHDDLAGKILGITNSTLYGKGFVEAFEMVQRELSS